MGDVHPEETYNMFSIIDHLFEATKYTQNAQILSSTNSVSILFGLGFLQIYTWRIDATFERKLHKLKLKFIQIRWQIQICRQILRWNSISEVFHQPIFIPLSQHN